MITTRLLRSMLTASLFLLFTFYSFAQNFPVSGKIQDAQGAPLPGVTVQIKGTKVITTSKTDGGFTISAPSGESTLVITHVGFQQQEVAIGNRAQIDITLVTDNVSLQGVVVVGYGTQKKSDVTGALTSISSKTIEERPVTNALQAMQGKAAGVNISSNIKPGELPVVRIRGNRSINASNDPLYVVDGIPIVSALGVTSFSINDINPNDIASIEILKDASATAIYGSRGANGVILISTKKGSKGRVSVNYNSTVSIDWYHSLTDWMSGGQWIDRWREGLINGRNYQPTTNTNLNVAPAFWYPDPFLDRTKMGLSSDTRIQNAVWQGYEWEEFGVTPKMRPTTDEERAMGWPAQVPIYNSGNIPTYDWINDAVRNGVTQNHQVSLSSGSDNSRLYMSLGYNNQIGVQRDQDFERFNLTMNGEINANKWLTLGISVIGSLSDQNYGIIGPNTANTGSKDLYSRAADQFPFSVPRDDNGTLIRFPGININLFNPLVDIDQAKNNRRTSAVLANTFAEIKFTPWLKYRINFGAQVRNFRNGIWTGPTATAHLNQRANTAGYSRTENFSWIAENLLYFDKTFNKIHTLGVTLLQSAQKSRRDSINTTVSGLANPESLWYDLGANSNGKPDGYGTGYTENTLTSFMARVNYNLMDKYLLTVSGRADGASVLAPGHQWDFFPSFAVAWKMQEEKFLQTVPWINELKPRIGYGVTGNSSVNPYITSGPLSRNPYIFGTVPGNGNLPQLMANPELGWERTAQLNVGLDFSVLNRRIAGSVEVYDSRSSDLLFLRSLNPASGYVQKWENIGKTKNRGVEITLSTINIDKPDFRWSTELNFTSNKEEIVELINGKQDMLANRLFIGQPTQVFYHYDNAGVWGGSKEDLDEMAKFNAAPNNHRFYPGTIRVIDQNGDNRINADDYVVRGSNRPKWTGGITNIFRYKNWSLSSFIYARVGQKYFGGYPNSYGGTFPNGRVENDVWSWKTQSGRWPIPIIGPTVDNFTPAMQYNDGSFAVVRHITLTYDAPQSFIRKATLKNLQLSVQILNPFMFGGKVVKWGINSDDETNWDVQSQANSNNTSPLGGTNNNTILPQSIVFGIRAGF
jgi:TonB-linked SusC/RagA family outer membrane protein